MEENITSLATQEYKKQMELLTSIKGIGVTLAAALIIATGGFTYLIMPSNLHVILDYHLLISNQVRQSMSKVTSIETGILHSEARFTWLPSHHSDVTRNARSVMTLRSNGSLESCRYCCS